MGNAPSNADGSAAPSIVGEPFIDFELVLVPPPPSPAAAAAAAAAASGSKPSAGGSSISISSSISSSSSRAGAAARTTLSAVIGRNGLPTLVAFYASWCPSCGECARRMARVGAEYAGRANVLLVSIEGDDGPAPAEDFSRRHLGGAERGGGGGGGGGSALQHFWIPRGGGGGSGGPPEAFGVRYVPHRLLISKDGRVARNYDVEWDDLDGEL